MTEHHLPKTKGGTMKSNEYKIACETQAIIDDYFERELKRKVKKKKTMYDIRKHIYTNFNYGGAK